MALEDVDEYAMIEHSLATAKNLRLSPIACAGQAMPLLSPRSEIDKTFRVQGPAGQKLPLVCRFSGRGKGVVFQGDLGGDGLIWRFIMLLRGWEGAGGGLMGADLGVDVRVKRALLTLMRGRECGKGGLPG